MYNGKGALDTLQHTHDVIALALRPDGKQLAVSTLDGTITLWDPQEGQMQVPTHSNTVSIPPSHSLFCDPPPFILHSFIYPPLLWIMYPQGMIEGRRDIRGGRLSSDRRAAGNSDSGAAFSSLTFSADGTFLLAGERI